jgi:predicted GTPase
MIVSDEPGTTRDSVDTVLTWHKRQFRIVDTAGSAAPAAWRSRGRSSR